MGSRVKPIDIVFLVFVICLVLFGFAWSGYLSYIHSNGYMHITIYSDTGDVIDEFEGDVTNYNAVDGTVTFKYDGSTYQYENAVVQVERNK